MKVNPPGKTSVSRLAVLVLLLFSCLPVSLLTDTGAEGSSLAGASPHGALAIIAGGQLKNCRITSTTPAQPKDTDKSLLQEALKSLVIDVNDAGLVTALCQWQGVAPENPKLTTESTFQLRGNYNLVSLQGTFTWGLNLSGPGNKDNWIDITQLNLRGNGNFKSAGGYIKGGDSVVLHFTISDWYLVDNKGEKSQNANAEGGITAFDATFDAVGFAAPEVPAVEKAKDSGSRFSNISGEVEYLPPGADPHNGWLFAHMDTKIPFGSHIKTAEDSNAIVSFADLSTFLLKPNSEIVIVPPQPQKSSFELINGNIYVNVKHMLAGESLEVKTSQAVTGIKGTTVVFEGTTIQSTVKVIEGTVKVTSNTTGKTVDVAAGNMVTATSAGLSPQTKFDISQEQAKWQSTGASTPSSTTQSTSQSSSGSPLKLPHLKIGPLSCFIATAAYGSQTAEQLDTLRAFRDKVLMKSEPGRWFVETYYYVSPPLADFIADKDWLRAIVRFELLDPIVYILQNSQQVWNNKYR